MGAHAMDRGTSTTGGVVWLLSGVEASPWFLYGAVRGLRRAGVPAEIHTFRWQIPLISIGNLFFPRRHRRRVTVLAERIRQYRKQHPAASIDIVAYSGGGAAALWLAEALPQDVRLRYVILVHPAVSPRYDLTQALRRVERRLVHFASLTDRFFLGLGTRLFGTMDRVYGDSAGRIGFDIEAAIPDARLRARFEQRMWDASMYERFGRIGNHLRVLTPAWNREYVAPYLRGEAARQVAAGGTTR